MQRLEGNCRQDKNIFIGKRGHISTVYSEGVFFDTVPFQGTNLWLTDYNCAVLLLTVGSKHFAGRINDCPTTLQHWHVVHQPHLKRRPFEPPSVLREIQLEGAGGDWIQQYFVTYLQVQSSAVDNIDEHQIALTADGSGAAVTPDQAVMLSHQLWFKHVVPFQNIYHLLFSLKICLDALD